MGFFSLTIRSTIIIVVGSFLLKSTLFATGYTYENRGRLNKFASLSEVLQNSDNKIQHYFHFFIFYSDYRNQYRGRHLVHSNDNNQYGYRGHEEYEYIYEDTPIKRQSEQLWGPLDYLFDGTI